MKKSIFINISVLTNLILLHLFAKTDVYGFSIIPVVASFGVTLYLRNIFISREKKINKKSRILLYILIVVSYISLLGLYFTDNLKLYYLIAYGLITLYLIIIGIYFNIIFDEARKI